MLKTVVLPIIQIILSIIIIGVVLMQSGKSAGLSGSIAGGAETFFGKNKGRTIDSILDRWTSVISLLFAIISVVYVILTNK